MSEYLELEQAVDAAPDRAQIDALAHRIDAAAAAGRLTEAQAVALARRAVERDTELERRAETVGRLVSRYLARRSGRERMN